jgi:hypothetical protein
MAIQLNTTITTPVKNYDSVWIRSLNIGSFSSANPITANIVVSPYNSQTGEIGDISKNIMINDVMATAATNPYIANTVGSIFAYVQDQIASGSVSFS